MNSKTAVNQLDKETSPYLLQHQHNPVNWYPWNQIALDKAREENKPILLSIGYSACHWCHVMAHESFEDDSIAALMNQHYINIKVDREERPDLDKIYQTAHSLLTQRPGGWPLTVFLTPDEHMPFFAGTYFPNVPRHGMPGFADILLRVSDAYTNNQQSIQQQNEAIRDVFKKINQQSNNTSDKLNARPIDLAKNQLKQNFDKEHGGFSSAPKFPHPSHLEFALRQWQHSLEQKEEDFDILNTATFTLENMARGGIFDQLAGGFCRYSVDNKWLIPHFEKMLYDNGPLLSLYSQAYTIVETPLFEATALATANWAIKEMQSAQGGYYSSLDADSENIEGKFYIWTPEEVKQHIDADNYKYFAEFFGLDQAANFEEKYWNLYQAKSLKEIADKYYLDIHQLHKQINTSKQHLLSIRNQRIRPGTDDKILTSWNALMIKGMSTAGRVFSKQEFIASAQKSLNFLHRTMWQNNRLHATHKDGKTQLRAYLDDYAYLLDAIIDLLQAQWSDDYLQFAKELADVLLDEFEDTKYGGFYFTGHHHEKLILRQKTYADDAIPSGNGTAAIALLKLGYLCSCTRYLDAAEKTLKASYDSANQSPIGHTTLLQALDIYLNNGMTSIIIRGDKDIAENWQNTLNKFYKPQLQHFYIPETDNLATELTDKKTQSKTCAYICKGTTCSAPVFTLDQLMEAL